MPAKDFNRRRLFDAMGAAGIDAVVASSPWNITYTGGAYLEIPQVTYLVTTSDGRQALVINEADAYYMRGSSSAKDLRIYRFGPTAAAEAENAVRLLTEVLTEFGLAKGKIGIEDDFLPASQQRRAEEMLPGASFVSGSDVFDEARLIKLPWEVELFRNAAFQTEKAIMTAFAMARVGDTEQALAASMQALVLRAGAQTLTHTVCSSGLQGTVVHAMPLPNPINPGEAVHVDFGARFDGYSTDLSRTAIVGKPTERQRFIHQALWDARAAILDKVRPGTPVKDLYDTNTAALAKVGLSNPWSTVGHSTGLREHEGFDITTSTTRVLEPGMIINIEPTHIEVGEGRYHIEDSIHITETGYEVLSDFYNSNEMFVIR
ncbi:MAG TPA: Xaa-Pro peptidase family protein [Devosiaceae bacterium]